MNARKPSAGDDPSVDGVRTAAIAAIVEGAPHVRTRSEFFLWTQGRFQVLLPHTLLVCGAYLRLVGRVQFDVFNSVVLSAEVLAALSHAEGPLMAELTRAWIEQGGRPIVVELRGLQGMALFDARRMIGEAAIDRLLVHGVARPQRPHEIETLFILAQAGMRDSLAVHEGMELLLPLLSATWRRVHTGAVAAPARRPGAPGSTAMHGRPYPLGRSPVTERELQILRGVRDGKTNAEIADALGITPVTVKNHVQKILPKLGASNRAHAVAQAIAHGLLQVASAGDGPA